MLFKRLQEDIEMLTLYLDYLESEKFLNMSDNNILNTKIRVCKKALIGLELIVNDEFWEGDI